MNFEIEGNWSGVMTDAEGFNALSTLDLREEGGQIGGEVTYSLVGDHEPGKEQRGEVYGRVDDTGQIALEFKLEQGMMVQFEGHPMVVRHHARSAFGGTYIVGGTEREPLAGGVAIFWMYADKGQQ